MTKNTELEKAIQKREALALLLRQAENEVVKIQATAILASAQEHNNPINNRIYLVFRYEESEAWQYAIKQLTGSEAYPPSEDNVRTPTDYLLFAVAKAHPQIEGNVYGDLNSYFINHNLFKETFKIVEDGFAHKIVFEHKPLKLEHKVQVFGFKDHTVYINKHNPKLCQTNPKNFKQLKKIRVLWKNCQRSLSLNFGRIKILANSILFLNGFYPKRGNR